MAAFLGCSSSNSMDPHFPLLLLTLTFSLLSLSFLLFSLFRRLSRAEDEEEEQDPPSDSSISSIKFSLSNIYHKTQKTHLLNSARLPSGCPKLVALFPPVSGRGDPFGTRSDSGDENDIEIKELNKKKKRKKKKKKQQENLLMDKDDLQLEEKNKDDLVCLYPFTTSSSAVQRKIKQQYDQLVKSHESKGLTLAQVGQFVNCLVDARNELQNKSECIKRKFTITKALLLKADRSSFDRLRRQICRLELEQKRLEEDAFVYNWLQHQLKLSPAYKKMLEIGACVDLKAKTSEMLENPDIDQSDMSFEEFLAQEKKDKFWQKYGKPKSLSG